VGQAQRASAGRSCGRLNALVGTDFPDKPALARKLGPVPKAIEKALWDVLAVRDENAPVITNRKGEPEPDPDLRDNENVPLPSEPVLWAVDPTERLASLTYRSAVDEYMESEVLPYVPDAWVDHDKTKIGYEIPLTRHFYKYVPRARSPKSTPKSRRWKPRFRNCCARSITLCAPA
jgi:hypothetical protein